MAMAGSKVRGRAHGGRVQERVETYRYEGGWVAYDMVNEGWVSEGTREEVGAVRNCRSIGVETLGRTHLLSVGWIACDMVKEGWVSKGVKILS